MDSQVKNDFNPEQIPLQRKTTLKWSENGELSAIDMARIIDRLNESDLSECNLSCDLEE